MYSEFFRWFHLATAAEQKATESAAKNKPCKIACKEPYDFADTLLVSTN